MKNGVCKLCLKDTRLAASHMMPRSLYGLCRVPGVDPVRVTSEVVMSTNRQTKDYVLCVNCEQLLSREGENWILPKLASSDGFALYEILSRATPVSADSDSAVYLADSIPEIDIRSIIHFSIGLFWKASVHPWKGGSKTPLIQLGPYSEQLRRFLLGEASLSTAALFVSVIRPPAALIGFYEPYEGPRSSTSHNFLCYVPGVQLVLSAGKEIPADLRRFFFSAIPHPVFVWDKRSTNIHKAVVSHYPAAYKSKAFIEQKIKRAAQKKRAANLSNDS